LDRYPALDISGVDGELVLAFVDDYSPTAVEEHDGALTVFFSDPTRRDQAQEAVACAWPEAQMAAREVPDEDWARRSQQNLTPVTIGRVTVAPPWAVPQPRASSRQSLTVVIEPSMAFGTGHHATTRLCLAALQALSDASGFVLDVGTGSGVLALAARRLGARRALGIDNDPDAIRCARDNLQLNRGIDGVEFEEADLASNLDALRRDNLLPAADVMTANLTGSLLCRSAPALLAALAPGGTLIVSGLLEEERNDVLTVYGTLEHAWESAEGGWVGLSFRRPR
jgi:ribosomal protein L11 methyltransferase